MTRPVGEMATDVASVVVCGCGSFLWAEGEEDLLKEADGHVRIAHPELVGTLSPLELAQPMEDEAAA